MTCLPAWEEMNLYYSWKVAPIREAIQLPSGITVSVGLSMGVCIIDETRIHFTPDQWLREADQALYESKYQKSTRNHMWTIV